MSVIFLHTVCYPGGGFFFSGNYNKSRGIMINHIVLTILFLTSSSGVLVCGVALVTEMCRVNPETLSHFRRVSEC